jgi:hypothetical protein
MHVQSCTDVQFLQSIKLKRIGIDVGDPLEQARILDRKRGSSLLSAAWFNQLLLPQLALFIPSGGKPVRERKAS